MFEAVHRQIQSQNDETLTAIRKLMAFMRAKHVLQSPAFTPMGSLFSLWKRKLSHGQGKEFAAGCRPRAVKQQKFEYAYLFGAVCSATGNTEAIVAPCVNKEVICQHLKHISEATKSERHAVVIMDGAGWHTDDIVEKFENVSIIKLPPYSPELNPIEQVRQWMRQNCIANRCFNGYEDIVNAYCDAWEKFRECADRVKSICSRDWINLIQ